MLAYLLLHRGPVRRDRVASTFWPDATEAEARANLRRHLHRLGQALPVPPAGDGWIESTDGSLRWNPRAEVWCDVEEFRATFETAPAQAVDLYRGDLLESWDDEWIVEPRRELNECQRRALRLASDSERAQGNLPLALGYLRRLLALDCWREDVLRDILQVRFESGDRAGALGEYRAFAAALRAEMAVEPMAETRAVFERLVAVGDAAPAAPRAYQLPLERTTFFDRQAELDELVAAWSVGAS